MKVDTMRSVDRFFGVPICFILSFFNRLGKFFLGKKKRKNEKILFIQLSEMGSVILSYSAIKEAERISGKKPFFLIFEKNRPSVELLNVIPKKNIITIRDDNIFSFVISTIKSIYVIRRTGIDTVLDFELFARFSVIVSFFLGAHTRVGFDKFHMEGLYRGDLFTHKVQYNPHRHISTSFLGMARSLKVDNSELPLPKINISKSELIIPKAKISKEDKESLFSKLKGMNGNITKKSRIVILNPNASELLPIRKWPLANYAKLGRKICELNDVYVVITGTDKEKEDAFSISKFVKNKKCIDLSGKTSLKELITLYSIAHILVSNDSGPAHFASMTNIKEIIFFGPETPLIYGPLSKNATCLYSNFMCSPCVSAYNHRKTECKRARCLDAIKVDEVYAIIDKELGD